MRWRWLLVLIPLGIGVAGTAVLHNDAWAQSQNIAIEIPLEIVPLLLGLTLTLLWLVGQVWQRRTAQKHAQVMTQWQEQATTERHQFLQRLDHELKNPLTAVRAGLDNLADAPTMAASQIALESMAEQMARLNRLTANLRKITELETRALNIIDIDLAELLHEAAALIRERAGVENQRVSLVLPQAPWPLPTTSGDWDLIFLAVYNLLENAIKFTESDTTIEIRAREDGRFVTIEIADTGSGIRPSDIPHIWEGLYRGENGRGVSGSGLGLALVKTIVERHDGQVALRSRPGQGTIVAIQLPIKRVVTNL